MKGLLAVAHWIDALNDRFAGIAKWAVLAACLISAGNAAVRYALRHRLERVARDPVVPVRRLRDVRRGQVLRVNEHVRVDVLYGLYPTRTKVLVDLLGLCLLPAAGRRC